MVEVHRDSVTMGDVAAADQDWVVQRAASVKDTPSLKKPRDEQVASRHRRHEGSVTGSAQRPMQSPIPRGIGLVRVASRKKKKEARRK